MKKLICLLAMTAAVIAFPDAARAITVDEVPNPQTTSGSFVEDRAGVLGPEYAALIDAVCRELEAKTKAELAVVTVDNLGGTTVEDFAVRLFKRFGIGKKGMDNGLLILFARDDRRVRIEVGYGLEAYINDAKAGRLLDTYAVPKFKQGEYARGLYDLTKATATEIAKSLNAPLAITDPASWPEEPAEAEATETPPIESSRPEISNVGNAVLIYVVAMSALTGFGLSILAMRVLLRPAKAAKKRAMGKGGVIPVFFMFGAVVMFMIGSAANKILLPVVGFFSTVLVLIAVRILVRKRLERYIAAYQLTCSKCSSKMDIVDEISDNKLLNVEELAEEKALGMDYEFWKCPKCDAVERFEVKLPSGGKCPQCKRRSLVTTTTVLEAATTSESGKEKIEYTCKNPKCDYRSEKIRKIPRVGSSGSSSGFGSSGGGSSFGGGSSGGGGSSRGW